MSNIKTTSVQLGDNVTATQNFTLRTNNNGTLTLARGNVGATTQDLCTFDAAGKVSFPQGRATWAPGEVIQVVSFPSDAGGSNSTGANTNVSGSSKIITPKSTNSIIVVHCTFRGRSPLVAATNASAFFQLMESGTSIGGQYDLGLANGAGNNDVVAPCAITARVSNSVLTARSFTLGAATSNSSSPAAATNQMFTITEIQQ